MRRRVSQLGIGVLVVVLAATASIAALAQTPEQPGPAPVEGATVTDAGWWNRSNPKADLPTGQPPPPPVPGVPDGSLVVGAAVGDPNAIAAVAIDPDSDPGADVSTFVLTLREVEDQGANLNTTFAAIAACPITGFWLGGDNGVWETRPTYDCDLATSQGKRADDGTWTWDLAAIGQLWADGTAGADGIALVEAVEAPTGFRTVLGGLESLTIGVRYEAAGGEAPPDPFANGGSFDPGGSFSTPPAPSFGSVGSGGIDLPSVGEPVDLPAADAPLSPAAPSQPESSDEIAADPIAQSLPSPLGSLPWWSAVLALLLVALAGLSMLALGPDGVPVAATTRRGVARALEAGDQT